MSVGSEEVEGLTSEPPRAARRSGRLPAVGRLGARHRLVLTLEILVTYVRLLPFVRRNDLSVMLAKARTCPARIETAPGESHELAVRLGHIVRRVLSVVPTDRPCLINALVLIRMLERRSVPGRLVIGVSNAEGFKAHAWVEHEGEPLLVAGAYERLIEL